MSSRSLALGVLIGAYLLIAADPNFLLGVSSSQDVDLQSLAAVDSQGAVYIASGNSIRKFSSPHNRVWTASLGPSFSIAAIAVDTSGNSYAASTPVQPSQTVIIAKVNADGSVSSSNLVLGAGLDVLGAAVDTSGRLWLTGDTIPGIQNPLATSANAYQRTLPNTTTNHGFVARLNAAGSAIEYATYLSGSGQDSPQGIAIDGSGSAFLTGYTFSPDFPVTLPANVGTNGAVFLTRLKPHGSGLVYSQIVAPGSSAGIVAADTVGDAAVTFFASQGWMLAHFNPLGVLTFSKPGEGPIVAMDSAGNTYVSGTSAGNHPVTNSIAQCGSAYLDVLSPTDDVLEATWLPTPAAVVTSVLAINTSSNSSIYVLSTAYYEHVGVVWLTALSPSTPAQPLALICLADAALYAVPGISLNPQGTTAGIAPGEIVSLFGQSLGPAQGVQPQVTMQSGYPAQIDGVQALFDGLPAPLLYVQDGQINAVVPWELAPGSTTSVCVSYNVTVTNCLSEPVIQAAPAVFTIDGVHAAALNQDGTLNSADHPAMPGTVETVFATGMGPVTPPTADGAIIVPPLPANVLGFSAEIVLPGGGFGGPPPPIPITVTYAGPAPYEVAGLSQINFQVPKVLSDPYLATVDLYLPVPNVGAGFQLYIGGSN